MEDTSEKKNTIEISAFKGDKLFNQNTPFVINLIAPESNKPEDQKRISADLICVIDISGSMDGEKIHLVKESLKILVDMMDKNDRIALILFSSNAKLYYKLNYLTEENKKELKQQIESINAGGGTNIASGLQVAVDILKDEKNNPKDNEGRSSSIILLSDGCDNYMDDIQLGEKLKSLTKGEGLSFTLNTFGYGYDHDAKIMNKLANLRDGDFYLVEDYNKVGEFFVSVLGGCISMISKNAELQVKLTDPKSKIVKIFGSNNLYLPELKDSLFSTKMLQFISGKDYTFVLEIQIDESSIKPDDILLDINFIYDDIIENTKKTINQKYKYTLTDPKFAKANEEYIRSQTYEVIEKAVKLREINQVEEGRKILKDMKEWLTNNYKGENKNYLTDIQKAEEMFQNMYYDQNQITYNTSLARQNVSKRMGSLNSCSNQVQAYLQSNYMMNYAQSQTVKPHFNNNFS